MTLWYSKKVSGQIHAMTTLLLNKNLPEPTEKEAGWAPEPIWTLQRTEKSLAPPGNQTTFSILHTSI